MWPHPAPAWGEAMEPTRSTVILHCVPYLSLPPTNR